MHVKVSSSSPAVVRTGSNSSEVKRPVQSAKRADPRRLPPDFLQAVPVAEKPLTPAGSLESADKSWITQALRDDAAKRNESEPDRVAQDQAQYIDELVSSGHIPAPQALKFFRGLRAWHGVSPASRRNAEAALRASAFQLNLKGRHAQTFIDDMVRQARRQVLTEGGKSGELPLIQSVTQGVERATAYTKMQGAFDDVLLNAVTREMERTPMGEEMSRYLKRNARIIVRYLDDNAHALTDVFTGMIQLNRDSSLSQLVPALYHEGSHLKDFQSKNFGLPEVMAGVRGKALRESRMKSEQAAYEAQVDFSADRKRHGLSVGSTEVMTDAEIANLATPGAAEKVKAKIPTLLEKSKRYQTAAAFWEKFGGSLAQAPALAQALAAEMAQNQDPSGPKGGIGQKLQTFSEAWASLAFRPEAASEDPTGREALDYAWEQVLSRFRSETGDAGSYASG